VESWAVVVRRVPYDLLLAKVTLGGLPLASPLARVGATTPSRPANLYLRGRLLTLPVDRLTP
jgi:hypothetical protein